uniref:Uncharacterized protein n=1 Tax=Oryza glumipatula TaxID=40148 RepID=A0A0E0B5V6_9ORYZ
MRAGGRGGTRAGSPAGSRPRGGSEGRSCRRAAGKGWRAAGREAACGRPGRSGAVGDSHSQIPLALSLSHQGPGALSAARWRHSPSSKQIGESRNGCTLGSEQKEGFGRVDAGEPTRGES